MRVPNGFAITAEAYRYMLEEAGALGAAARGARRPRPDDVADLARRAKRAREIVYGAGLPDGPGRARSCAGYRRLQDEYGEEVSLAVRSSATAEDLPTASFAGQQETFLNVRGEESLLDACRRCFASLFTDRAIHYRIDQGFDHFKVALSIGVMKMVRSDLASSGVMFSLDTESGFRDVVFITGAYGLGENVVQGAVDPDEFYVHKPTLRGRSPRRAAPPPRRQGGEDGLRRGRDEAHDPQRPDARRRTASASASSDADVLELADYAIDDRAPLRAADGHGVGEGRPRRQALHRPGPARDGRLPAPGVDVSRPTCSTAAGEVVIEGRSVGEKIAVGRGPGHRERRPPRRSSARARCWSPTRPRRTGSR